MKQLIARIDDDLHRRLKAVAKQEGRSVNSFVNEVLFESVSAGSDNAQIARRLELKTRRVIPPQPARVPSRRAISKLTKAAGTAVSEALSDQRSSR
ncbi:MAG: toxin-antitoxin system HicB family antitoxin [Actinomycetota bacterium]